MEISRRMLRGEMVLAEMSPRDHFLFMAALGNHSALSPGLPLPPSLPLSPCPSLSPIIDREPSLLKKVVSVRPRWGGFACTLPSQHGHGLTPIHRMVGITASVSVVEVVKAVLAAEV